MSRNYNYDNDSLGGAIIGLILQCLLGGWCSDIIIGWFGKDIPFFWDMVIGFFLYQLTIPVAIVGSILRAFGVF